MEIPDSETGRNFMDQLQFWQEETERQASKISSLKIQVKELQSDSHDQNLFLTQVVQHQNDEIVEQKKEEISIAKEDAGNIEQRSSLVPEEQRSSLVPEEQISDKRTATDSIIPPKRAQSQIIVSLHP